MCSTLSFGVAQLVLAFYYKQFKYNMLKQQTALLESGSFNLCLYFMEQN